MKTIHISMIAALLAGPALADGMRATAPSGGSPGAGGSAAAATTSGSGAIDGGGVDFDASATTDASGGTEAADTGAVTGTGVGAGLLGIEPLAGTGGDAGPLETDAIADTAGDETPLSDGDETGLSGPAPVAAEMDADLEGEATMTEFGSAVVDTEDGEALPLEPGAPVVIAPAAATEEDQEPIDEIVEGVGGEVQPRTIEVE